jgi:hypothetical protein
MIWGVGCGTTYQAFLALGLPQGETILSAPALWWAMLFQLGFTLAEQPVFRGKGNIFGYAILALDSAINAGGIYQWVRNIDLTPTYAMLNSAVVNTSGYSVSLGPLADVVISLAVGVLIAFLPEGVWASGRK